MGSLIRRIRWWGWTIAALVIVIAAAGGFVWTEHALSVQMGALSPDEGAQLASSAVKISCALPGYVPGRGSVSVMVDGKPVEPALVALQNSGAELTVSLADGTHTVAVAYDSANVFSRHFSRSSSFSIDTTAPAVQLVSPLPSAILGQPDNRFVATFSEDASATLLVDGVSVPLRMGDPAFLATSTSTTATTAATPAAPGGGARSAAADLVLAEGKHLFTLTVTDAIGNRTVQTWEALADFQSPTIKEENWPGATWGKTSASLIFAIADNFPDHLTMSATVDGQKTNLLLTAAPVPDVSAPAKTGNTAKNSSIKKSAPTTSTTSAPAAVDPASASNEALHYLFVTGDLSEGTHDVSVSVADSAGHASTWHRTFVVDTTETFGARPLGEGATGKDVVTLQKILTAKGLYTGHINGVYDSATAQVVANYNTSQGLSGGSVLNADAVGFLLGSIRIDLSERKLYLYSDGKLLKTYRVAVGQPSYPTPKGHWKIISKEVNPTWNPPDSPWAEGAVPIGPGPDDPLGTRWMGLSAPAVGIHGTNQPWSIGTYASHGCIRMQIPDSEDLFNRVFIGTPVDIVP